jgi:hydroxymethylbilane synthase
MRTIRVGSRGSRLALVQARAIMEALAPDADVELEIIQTQGDRVTDRPLSQVGGSGLFIKEIEKALLEERIDLAVHSMKDVPSRIAEGLTLAATTERKDPRDAFVSRRAESIESLPEGARLATGSLRRRSQLLVRRPDLRIEELRGNVPTRLAKLDASEWEGIVLAAAGLERLGLSERIRSLIPLETMLPAVGQGALAVEIRESDEALAKILARVNHEDSERAVAAERALLARLEGGCQVPIGAYAEIADGELRLRSFVGSIDGAKHLKREIAGRPEEAEALGLALADQMLDSGAAEIIRDVEASLG